jgi:hypothetical protein
MPCDTRGRYTVKYVAPDASTRGGGQVEPGPDRPNARQATADPKAVYYIGEFNSGASAVPIPILDAAGLAQVAPANTAPPAVRVNFCKFHEQSCFTALATSIKAPAASLTGTFHSDQRVVHSGEITL